MSRIEIIKTKHKAELNAEFFVNKNEASADSI
jgi:hypothetical protein